MRTGSGLTLLVTWMAACGQPSANADVEHDRAEERASKAPAEKRSPPDRPAPPAEPHASADHAPPAEPEPASAPLASPMPTTGGVRTVEELRAALERFDSGDPNPAIPPGRGVATLRGDRTAAASCSSRAGIDDGAPLTCDADMTRCVSNSSVLLLDRTPEGGHFIRAVVDYEGEAPSEESRATRAVLARRDRICEGTDALLRGDPAPLRQGLWDLGLVSINENARPRRTAVETEVQAWVGEHLPHTGDDEPYGISHHCGPRVAAELHSIVQGELITCSEDRCSIGMEGNSSSAVMLGRSESGELRVLVSALTMSGDVSPSQFRALAQHVAPLVCP